MNFNTKVIHGGQHHESATGSVNVPVFLTSTFAQKSPGVHSGYEYSSSQSYKTGIGRFSQALKTEREVWPSGQV